ncbi:MULTISPECIES: hypothetical protein [Mesorhizobium]|uniref:hypothetical protein n=1 Tax=Mesorhizobium sp. TaxID=1871066 RepID=UPI000B285847|nr:MULTISPECIES: hypothetical protein [Mesorhizobium]RWM68509.1 MAG: hypothetical protein EOR82_24890 [Mesorhizobium sp.]TIO22235.1 MAG: hypothetical protein E5X83_26155 [Mesorhizobium sp.]TJV55847.1 MAG: hypothetical protein E5X82_25670 [Mesorhizobium sp.]
MLNRLQSGFKPWERAATRIPVSLTVMQRAEIKAEAARRGTSEASVIRIAINEWLATNRRAAALEQEIFENGI